MLATHAIAAPQTRAGSSFAWHRNGHAGGVCHLQRHHRHTECDPGKVPQRAHQHERQGYVTSNTLFLSTHFSYLSSVTTACTHVMLLRAAPTTSAVMCSLPPAAPVSMMLLSPPTGDNQLLHPFTYLVTMLWAGTTVFWLVRMNRALALFHGLFIIPALQVYHCQSSPLQKPMLRNGCLTQAALCVLYVKRSFSACFEVAPSLVSDVLCSCGLTHQLSSLPIILCAHTGVLDLLLGCGWRRVLQRVSEPRQMGEQCCWHIHTHAANCSWGTESTCCALLLF
jgi:hypothetical protein